ncbi:transposase [Desulfarculales bacterium]
MANRPGPKGQNVLADQTILLIGSLTDCPYPLRRLAVWDEKNQKQVVLLTNHHKLTASIVADIYKDRREIELFFKALKQNFKVKIFVGTSSNALEIQIWTALIALLLLKWLHHLSLAA